MAGGGKQTPRQRMINMMYLVLTAMLALQVSSSIIDKFIFLNASLEHALEGARKGSENALESLKKDVAKQGNSSEGLGKIKHAEKLKAKTAELIGEIDKIKKKLITDAGGGIDPHTGTIKDAKEETKVEILMLGASKNGVGYDLKKKLDAYTDALMNDTDFKKYGLTKEDIQPLAEGNENNPIYKHDQVQRNKNFAEANFGQTPVVAALAVLTQKQTDIIRYEQTLLKKIGAGDLSNDVKFDNIVAIASADANIVAQGSEYRAEMFISASSKKTGARMTYNGSGVTVKDGIGEVKFTASGRGEQSWKGTITINTKGKDTTFPVTKKFEVVEPVLIVKAKANFPLYRRCANPLETAVPALGAAYKPSFSVTNGTASPGGKQGDVTIFPGEGAESILTVTSAGKKAGEAKFRVNPVPAPEIYVSGSSGNRLNFKNPMPMLPVIKIMVVPDETFKNTLPDEARYEVTSFEVSVFRGGRRITNVPASGGQMSTGSINTRPGDGIQIEIKGVNRINSRNEREVAPIKNPLQSFYVGS